MTGPRRAGGSPPDPDPAAPARPVGEDGPTGGTARRDQHLPDVGESRYPPAAPGRPGPTPPTVRIELVLVDGPEGAKLRATQAAAIREALRWFAEHPNPDPPKEPPEPPEDPK
jgi:hypothetical protein